MAMLEGLTVFDTMPDGVLDSIQRQTAEAITALLCRDDVGRHAVVTALRDRFGNPDTMTASDAVIVAGAMTFFENMMGAAEVANFDNAGDVVPWSMMFARNLAALDADEVREIQGRIGEMLASDDIRLVTAGHMAAYTVNDFIRFWRRQGQTEWQNMIQSDGGNPESDDE